MIDNFLGDIERSGCLPFDVRHCQFLMTSTSNFQKEKLQIIYANI